MKKALLAKWFWKLENEQGLWQTVLLKKYVKVKYLSGINHKIGDSQFCSSLISLKHIFYQNCKKNVGDGKNTRFCEDCWRGSKPLYKIPS